MFNLQPIQPIQPIQPEPTAVDGLPLDSVLHMDCLEGLKRLPSNSVDLVVTDPPYLMDTPGSGGCFGRKHRSWFNELEKVDIVKGFNTDILDELRRVLKYINIYLWCSKNQLYTYMDYFSDCNMDLLTWHKTNPIPTCSNKYLSDTEYLLFFRDKRGVAIYGSYETKHKYYVTPLNTEDKNRWNHPTIKPLHIIKNLITNSSKHGDIVLDPFMGSGTTAVAAKALNRHYIGYENNTDFYNACMRRIEEDPGL